MYVHIKTVKNFFITPKLPGVAHETRDAGIIFQENRNCVYGHTCYGTTTENKISHGLSLNFNIE